MVRKHVIVRGLVHGVGFRYSTREEARRIGVAGYVRNRAGGAVEAEIEAGEAAVAEMIDWLGIGPDAAVVESVEVSERKPTGESGFRIEV